LLRTHRPEMVVNLESADDKGVFPSTLLLSISFLAFAAFCVVPVPFSEPLSRGCARRAEHVFFVTPFDVSTSGNFPSFRTRPQFTQQHARPCCHRSRPRAVCRSNTGYVPLDPLKSRPLVLISTSGCFCLSSFANTLFLCSAETAF